MRNLIALVVVNLLFTSAGFAVGPFRFELKGIPKVKDSGCVETAHLFGQVFKSATGAKVLRSHCDAEHDRSYDIRIGYEAEKELPLVTSESGTFYAGHYAKLEDCVADLPAQLRLFEAHTKLKAFHSYCYIDQSSIETSIGTRFDAVGTPAEWPQVFMQRSFTTPIAPETLVQDLEAALKARNQTAAVVTVVRPKNGIDFTRIVMKYFGAELVSLKLKKDDFYYATKSECDEAKGRLTAVFAEQGIFPATSFCSLYALNGRVAINFIATQKTKWYRSELAKDLFQSFSDCNANRDRILNYFKVTLKQPVFGLECAQSRGDGFTPFGPRAYRAELLFPCASFGDQECRRPLFP